jgi:hypothetical protein
MYARVEITKQLEALSVKKSIGREYKIGAAMLKTINHTAKREANIWVALSFMNNTKRNR